MGRRVMVVVMAGVDKLNNGKQKEEKRRHKNGRDFVGSAPVGRPPGVRRGGMGMGTLHLLWSLYFPHNSHKKSKLVHSLTKHQATAPARLTTPLTGRCVAFPPIEVGSQFPSPYTLRRRCMPLSRLFILPTISRSELWI
jgi:hypothetical protein